jgi:hypothetical protein
MNDTSGKDRGAATILGILLGVGLVLGGWALGVEIKEARLGDRYVSVRGLAERTVKADLAVWDLGYSETGDDLASLYAKGESDRKIVVQFLNGQGILPTEIEMGVAKVTDNQAREFGGTNKAPHRYILEEDVTVQTARVDQLAAAAQKTVELLKQGVVMNSGDNPIFGNRGPAYRFNGLNAIKPDMITEATRNARTAAERFASDAGSRVGTIRTATQGVFSISAANAGSATGEGENGGGFGGSDDASMIKTVRVVTSVDYYLEK